MRRLASGSLALLVAGLVALVAAGPAAAHNTLISAEPEDGARVATGPERVTLTFDAPVTKGFTTVTVTGPGETRWEAGEPTESGSSVSAPVRPLGPAGEYVVGYRIVSADGHPVSGTVAFRLTADGTGTPAPPTSATDDEVSADGDAGGGGVPVWVWVVAAVLLLAAGVLLALRLGRASQPPR